MQDTIFLVDKEPYCLWDYDLKARNQEFLKGLDPNFFDYSANAHMETGDDRRASIALKLILHHASETLFSLLGAYIQAPDCCYAWLNKCSTPELRSLVARITQNQSNIFTKLNIDPVSWEQVASSIFHTFMPGTERQSGTIEKFALLWARLASEFINPVHIDEYNALKHGFRIQGGGFAISIGKEPYLGIPAPESEMQLLGRSDFGSSFFTVSHVPSKTKTRSLYISRISINWSIERLVLLNQLTHISINNVITALRVLNGWSPSSCEFLRPESDEDFDAPWKYSPGVTNMNWSHTADETNTKLLTKEQLLAILNTYKRG